MSRGKPIRFTLGPLVRAWPTTSQSGAAPEEPTGSDPADPRTAARRASPTEHVLDARPQIAVTSGVFHGTTFRLFLNR